MLVDSRVVVVVLVVVVVRVVVVGCEVVVNLIWLLKVYLFFANSVLLTTVLYQLIYNILSQTRLVVMYVVVIVGLVVVVTL
jgi:hypothetical protein